MRNHAAPRRVLKIEILSMLFLILFQSPCKLVWAGGRPGAAVDAVYPTDRLVDVHAFDQPGNALSIAGAAAYVLDVGDLIVFYIKMNFP